MNQIRAFIAVTLDEELRQRIHARQQALEHRVRGMKWVEPDQYHLTIKFLGNVGEGKIDQLATVLEDAYRDIDPFFVRLKGIGAFPYESSPRVVWIGLDEGRDDLKRLWERTEQTVDTLGFPPDKREFSPHLTLARAKAHRGRNNLMPIFDRLRDHQWGATYVDHLVLMKSELGRRGPEYTQLARFPLTDDAPVPADEDVS